MERIVDERLQKLFDEGAHIYSISRLNALNQCKYQAYLNYIKQVAQKNIGIYGVLGGKVHDKLELCIHGKATMDDVKKAILEELDDCEMFGIEFPLDRNNNSTIRNNWLANMTKFAEEFKIFEGKFETEQLILYHVKDNCWMQGYIDLIQYNEDGTISILDWKTSSQFTKDHLTEAGRQLVLYALAKEAEGYKVSSVKWVMLKYCETTWKQKNGKLKSKVSEWRNMIKDLENPIMKTLSDLGIDEIDADVMWHEALDSNSWNVFPQEVRDKFQTTQYIREYDMTPEIIQETLNYITQQIDLYETLGDCENNYKPCDINKQSFFCNSLCGYGGKSGQCKYWNDYCATFDKDKDDEFSDLF